MARYVRWIAAALVAAGATLLESTPAQQTATRRTPAGQGHDHGHSHLTERDVKLPQDFASAVARLRVCGKALHREVEAQRYDQVHAALDEALLVLGKLMPLARASGVPKDRWLEINLAGKELKKQLTLVDEALHAARRVDLRAASKPIDESLRKLEAVAAEHGSARQARKP